MAESDLTAGELAYLESGGENADGLMAENPGGVAADAGAASDAAPVVDKTPPAPAIKDVAPVGKEAVVQPAVKDAAAVVKEAPAAKVVTAGDEDEEDEPADPQATIPYQQFARMRKKLRAQVKDFESKLTETNEKFARGDERLRLLSEVMAPQPNAAAAQAEEDPEPDPNEDIIGWAQWSRRENGRLREAINTTQGFVKDTSDDQTLRTNYQQDAISFARETPDFLNAYNHLITARAATLEAQGFGEKEIRTILVNEEKGLVQRANNAGKRPAAMIYAMAQNMGYRKPAPVDPAIAAAAAAQTNGNGKAAATPAANGAAKPSVTEEIERIARGQAAGKSLGDAGGASSDLTIESLASMSDRDFQALYAKRKGDVDNLMGRRAH